VRHIDHKTLVTATVITVIWTPLIGSNHDLLKISRGQSNLTNRRAKQQKAHPTARNHKRYPPQRTTYLVFMDD
jgi:hypothetical protein